ncbi:MAG: UDP-2,4-diacetamido-2,4,6-trideoxy-beta-L-altropyranose hydrolase [Mizugakiibacter sp.]|uniref:UDP-2,4-diacetamido-2,4, 6-trideoxy-beta-L-altropyranose hydrolase n=1 Tax=Mizugakiibacter sp. TaxID=1972610 RepID=UPI0031CA02ED|nr:UDP-2,4-diacetamido-2,4,6-trideoxy-beta-L-altropyranose hydrolase [Xanthomonadaceae bacterium]
MKVAFRTDASLAIGSGHLMRCLTLADALRKRGAACTFVCREHPGHRNDLVRARGFALQPLPPPTVSSGLPGAGKPRHAGWLGADGSEDAAQTIAAIGTARPDWLIVDHYAVDAAWERRLGPHVRRIMVIDDLADRSHDADLLLDQNLGRREEDYEALVPAGCRLLTGPLYALLRPEFARLREYSLARRRRPGLGHLLIGMGGVDADNATGAVLDALHQAALPVDCRVSVVLGSQAPWLAKVREQAARLRQPSEVRVDVADMAELMSESDLAIGAAGTTSWERCCLGLPAIVVVLADNQRSSARALAACGSAQLIGMADDIAANLPPAFASLTRADALARMSQSAAAVCDGRGLERVIEYMYPSEASVQPVCAMRPMVGADVEQVLRWRNHPDIRRYMYTRHEISPAEHEAWFERSLRDRSRHLLIAEEAGRPLGFVSFKETGSDRIAEWGFYAAPDAPKGTGRKLGAAALAYGFGALGFHKICGQAMDSNERSIALHRALGFSEEGRLRDRDPSDERYRVVLCFGLLADAWRHGK